jgi:zinc transporter ZupT
MVAPVLATVVGIGSATAGVWLTGAGRNAAAQKKQQRKTVPRLFLPFSAGILLGVALFGLLPELAVDAGWFVSLLLFGAGYGLLIGMDRYVYPVCPTCSHSHDHSACADELHGFALPLVAAAAIHSFLDGWSIAAVQAASPLGVRLAVPLAVTLHKIPEGLALGGIVRGAMHSGKGSRTRALAGSMLAEACTIAGAGIALALAPRWGAGWVLYPLGLTAGWIFYLGFHAVHEEWKRCGAAPAFVSALTGLAGAAVIQRGAEALFR